MFEKGFLFHKERKIFGYETNRKNEKNNSGDLKKKKKNWRKYFFSRLKNSSYEIEWKLNFSGEK